jgi:colanic acid/amylovoran biosynthesis protein
LQVGILTAMRILVENGTYELRNVGDIAMLQVCVTRLREHFPAADIYVHSKRAERLARYVPGTIQVDPGLRDACLPSLNLFPDMLRRRLPEVRERALPSYEQEVQLTDPFKAAMDITSGVEQTWQSGSEAREFIDLLGSMDLVVACGGGYLTDDFQDHACAVLQMMGAASRLGRRFALFGQGIGPVHSPKLLSLLRLVLPQSQVLALREGTDSVAICRSAKVPESSIVVTGDDALGCASDPPSNAGNALGFSLRMAAYAGISRETAKPVCDLIGKFAANGASLQPIPISFNTGECDVATASCFFQLPEDVLSEIQTSDTPQQVITLVRRCRIVVTGTYHAGVFALSQGIPVVGLAASDYYTSKLLGLAAQFGTDPNLIIRLGNPDWEKKLTDAMAICWSAPEAERQRLLAAAHHQVRSSKVAYSKALSGIGIEQA